MSDKRINKIVKRFMEKRPFKLVESFKEANVLLVFDRNNLQRFNVMCKEDYNEEFLTSLPANFKIYYLKSSNIHL